MQPFSALPTGQAAPALPPVDTGGARIVAEGLRGAPVTGAVGERQYVQAAAGMMTILDKASGVAAGPPRPVSALYAATSDQRGMRACALQSSVPVSVLYDYPARRWVIAYLAAGGATLCLATSAGPNAAGRYQARALALRPPATRHPILAVWRDDLILSYDSAQRDTRVCGIGRAMAAEHNPVLRCRSLPRSGAVPASLQPQALVAAGTPALLLALDASDAGWGSALTLWRYRPADNALSAPVSIPVARFSQACAACIAQPFGGAALPAHADRLSPGAVYDGQALLLNHTVAEGDGRTAIRWYEVRAPFGAAQVYQQGSYAPDAEQRWMGSIGIDKAGDIALGYALSSGATASGIRYTGRVRTDPPGRLQQEETIVNGSGAQSRAEDLSVPAGALSLDPTDGCTFWYTQHYIQSSGAQAWRSRIASFKFRRCN
ncbi:MAG TPA: hypothetical protein VFS95_02380 [Telluria sp.]|nr:hypothetical protein [Telluria sp.]